jgi:hypothetical protein
MEVMAEKPLLGLADRIREGVTTLPLLPKFFFAFSVSFISCIG